MDAAGEGKPKNDSSIDDVVASVSSLSPDGLERLNASLLFRIDHMVRRIEYAESRRATMSTLAIGLVAASVALFAVLVDAPWNPIRIALGVLAASVLLVAIVTLAAWLRQTNPPYGFIEAPTEQRPWKWFYRDALQDHKSFTFDWFRRKESSKNKKDPIAAFSAQWEPFAKRELQLADIHQEVLQNLQQVYLLHVNEKY